MPLDPLAPFVPYLPVLKWTSNLLLVGTGASAVLTKSYTENAAGERRLTLLGWFQVAGFVLGFALFAISEKATAIAKADTDAVANAQARFHDVIDQEKDLLRQANRQTELATLTSDRQKALAATQADLAHTQSTILVGADRILESERAIQTTQTETSVVQKQIQNDQTAIAKTQQEQVQGLSSQLSGANGKIAFLENSSRRLNAIEIEVPIDSATHQALMRAIPRSAAPFRECFDSAFTGGGKFPQAVLIIESWEAGYHLRCDATEKMSMQVTEERQWRWKFLGREHVTSGSQVAANMLRILFGDGLRVVLGNGAVLGAFGPGSGSVSASIHGTIAKATAPSNDVSLADLGSQKLYLCAQHPTINANFTVDNPSIHVGLSSLKVHSVCLFDAPAQNISFNVRPERHGLTYLQYAGYESKPELRPQPEPEKAA